MKKAYLLLMFLGCVNILFSQVSTIIPAPVSIAQTAVADIQSWCAFHNPAVIGKATTHEAGFTFENKFLIQELSTKAVQGIIATNKVNIGFAFSHVGFSTYNEMLAGVGFGRNFSDKFSMGVQFNYYTSYFNASNEYRSALLCQIGLTVEFTENFTIGFSGFNLFQTNIKTEFSEKHLPSVFSIGSEYCITRDLIWRTQVDKEIRSPYRFATGMEYCMLNLLTIKLGGYVSRYWIAALGTGIKAGSFNFDLNCELHPILGLNTLATVTYQIKNKN